MPGPAQRAGCFCALGLCLYAVFCSWKIAVAGFLARGGSAAAVAAAARLDPGNADYQLRLADTLDTAGADSTLPLRRVLALNPYRAEAWIRIGLNAESTGNMQTAERALLAAARVSRLYEPRWTLANFYFRQGNQARFWRWAAQALAVSYAPPDALFQLCLRFDPAPGSVLARVVPEREQVVDDYLRFLISHGYAAEALPVARRLLSDPGAGKTRTLLLYVDTLARAGAQSPALEVWNALCREGLAPQPVLDPVRGVAIGNPEFARRPLGHGFDWRLAPVRGTTADYAPGELRFSFSGREAEAGEVLAHLLPLARGVRYRLHVEYQTRGVEPGAGLRLHIRGQPIDIESPSLSSEDWAVATTSFTASEACICRLALDYSRPRGHTRLEGVVRLRRIALERAS